MNTYRNSVFLTGIAGSDPVIIYFKNNKRLARISMAIDNSYKNSANEFVKQTDWFDLVCWDKKVDLVDQVVKKGSRFSIEGKLSNSTYVDKKGIKRYITRIVVLKVEVAD